MLMSKLGWEVKAFEPDPIVCARAQRNLDANGVIAELHEAAVSFGASEAPFTRVVNNLTGSHLAGYKDPHGPTETIMVKTVGATELFDWADFVKIDAEGHEAVILSFVMTYHMQKMDIMTEVRG